MSNTELSEFFSLVSKEKSDNLDKLKTKINNPESDLANLFEQLEDAHREITKVSEEISDEKILTEEDQNRLEVFSNLMTSFDSVKEIPEEVKVVRDVELKEIEEPEEVIPEEVVKTDNIISDIVDALDVMGAKTEVKEEIDQISALRRDFDNFRNLIQRDMSGAGSGEVRLEFLDDVQSSTAKVDGKVLQYSSSDGKWVGADAGSSPAADDISAGDAAVTLTTTSGNITIDAAANNTDIIFKGTDASSDITMLTLDGSEAGAATFNSTVTTTGLTIGSTAVTSTAAELNILDGVTSTAAELNILDGVTSTAAELNILDGVTSTAAELNILDGVTSTAAELNILDGVTSTAAELNAVDGITAVVGELNALDLGSTAVGTAIASKAVILDSNKDYTGIRNLTATTHIGALTGNADTATALATARTIGGTSFDGSANIAVGLAALATTVTITDNESTNESNALIFTAGGDVDGGNLGLESDGTLTYNPSTGKVTATGFVGTLTGDVTGDVTGNADTATALASARTIGGTSFDGTANIAVGLAATATALASARTIGGTSFDGTANIAVALAAVATAVTVTDNEDTNENNVLVFVAGADADGGDVGLESDGNLIYNPSTGTLSVPNIVVSGTQTIADTVTMQAENAIVFEGATADLHETTLTIIDPTSDRTINLPNQSGTIPVLAAASNTAVTSTPAELNILDGATVVVAEINALDIGTTAVGTAVASKAVILDSNKDYTGVRNFTLSGELDAGSLDVSGDADIDGTLEADAITVDGTTLAEYIADTAGAMVSSNTETGITVTYQDGDNTIDFAVDAAQTAITSIYNSSLAIGYGSSHANINFGTDNQITFDIDGTGQIVLKDGILHPVTDSDVDLGKSDKYWKDAYIDTITTTGAITSGGILKTDDTTAATSTTDGSLQTDGGLSVAADAVIGNDLFMLSDAAVLTMGADKDVTLTHVHNTGILLNSTMVIQFNDASQNIGAPSNAILDINATDEVEINATLIDVNGNLDVSGTGVIAGAITGAAITASGILKTDDTTAATSTTDGSLQTDGGLSVAADAVIGDDLIMLSDAAVIHFGADKDITLTHTADTGLLLSKNLNIDDGGSLVVGRSATPITMGGSAATLQVVGTAQADSTIAVARWSADASAPRIIGFKTRNATIGSTTIVQDDDALLDIVAYGDDAASAYFEAPAAMIRMSVDGTPGTNDMPGRITFHTSADGGQALNERMRLDTSGNLDVTGDITGSTINADGDTAADDNAAIGYTSTEGLILTGQGSSNDITFKNDADTVAMKIETGSTTLKIVGNCLANTFSPEGDTSASASAQLGWTAAEGLILTGQGSTNDVTIKNDADTTVLRIPTGTTNVTLAGTLTVTSNISCTGNVTVDGLIFDNETMDIYDTGTWSPILRPYTTVFDSIAYDPIRQGHYVIIGKLCFFEWSMRTDGITAGSGSGGMNIFGLPVAGVDRENHYKTWFVGSINGWAGEFPSEAQQHGEATHMALNYNADHTTGATALQISDCDTGYNKNWSTCNGCYETA